MALRQLQLHCGICNEIRLHTQETPNHTLHIVLTALTGGLWAIPWILVSMQAKPALCGKCGTLRPAHSALQLTSGATQQQLLLSSQELEGALDQALQKIKGPLKHCRTKHGIIGDVVFRLRYEPSGTIAGVTIDNGPPNITPGFISDSSTIIKGMLVLPPTMHGGIMLFTDLDGESADPYR
ncbi:MAG: hypothetical protein M4D80_22065 [Myxococcota bacterium]|nr:hypothetical protein [Myxococcota bacterium]